jgi:tRNA dimethylallyltransferase
MPIIVGGTGLYLRWLIYGSLTAPKKNEEVFNKILAALHSENNWDVSIKRLETIDPKYAATIPRNQYNRLARFVVVWACGHYLCY